MSVQFIQETPGENRYFTPTRKMKHIKESVCITTLL